ncbi:tetratricopeptide repeat protein [Deminuibacter soli]|nr:tetratricopeptide repeat protein [Deminuibacter soli]
MKLFNRLMLLSLAACAMACNQQGNSKNDHKKTAGEQFSPLLKELQQQVQLHPDSAGVRLRLATVLDSIGDFKQALRQMDSLIAKDTANYGLLFTRAQIFEDAGDTTAAMQAYDHAIKIYPSPDAVLALANLLAEKKNPQALQLCGQVQQMRMGREYDAHCAFIAGVFYARSGKHDEALKAFDACIADNYTYMEAYIEKGLVYFDQKKYDEALKIFVFASKVNNLYADAYYYQARAFEMMGNKDSATLRYQQSLSLDKNLSAAHEGLKRIGAE